MRKPCLVSSILLLGACLLPAAAARAADGFGAVQGQVVLQGQIPQRPVVPGVGPAAVCGNIRPLELIVDKDSKGIANAFVYLRKAPEQIHPQLAKSAAPEVIFDQKNCEFTPRALFVRTGQAVRVKSADPFPHNTRTSPIRNMGANVALGANDRKGVVIRNPLAEPLPFQVECNLHPHMKAFWLVLDHPYAAVTDDQGKFTIENLPEGEHTLTIWHEGIGYVDRALGQTFKVKVENGKTTTLPVVSIPVEKFK